jgi:DNA-binding FadR family transcriptional regulator
MAQLAQSVAAMRRNLHDSDAYVELDMAFHQLIAAATRNTMIAYLVEAIRKTIKDTLHESALRRLTDEQLERVQAGHEAILASLEQGDAEEAGRAMTAHFADAVLSLVYSTSGNLPDPDPSPAE